MKMSVRFALFSAVLGLLSSSAALAEVDCIKLALSVKLAVAADPAATLQIVEKEVAATPACACELVKAAIEGAKASVQLVAAIVETAATVAPEHRRLIGQCAVAVAPDALPNVQAVLAKLEPKSTKIASGSKDAKSAKAGQTTQPPASNPLDFPGSGIADPPVQVGGNPGGPGGFPILPFGPSIFVPPIVTPPIVVPPPVTPPTNPV
jgi:hypothetical protein